MAEAAPRKWLKLASFDYCFLDRRRRLPFRWSFYGLRLNNETIAIGGGWSDAPFAVESWEPSEVLERSELQIRSWLDLYSKGPTALVSTLQCVHPRLEIRNNLPYEIMNTDGILTIRGNDLFKFAPAIACDVCDMLHIPMATTR